MKRTIVFFLVAAGAFAAAESQTFTGKITDTMCGAQHTMMKGQPDEACVHMCVKGSGSQFALFDGKTVLRLSDQKKPAPFAGQAVKITGTYNEKTKTIKVDSIQAAQ